MSETVGDRIRKARITYGMSQVELARRIGIHKNSLNLIESGKTEDPAGSIIRAVADKLRVSTDYLLGRIDAPESEDMPTVLESVGA